MYEGKRGRDHLGAPSPDYVWPWVQCDLEEDYWIKARGFRGYRAALMVEDDWSGEPYNNYLFLLPAGLLVSVRFQHGMKHKQLGNCCSPWNTECSKPSSSYYCTPPTPKYTTTLHFYINSYRAHLEAPSECKNIYSKGEHKSRHWMSNLLWYIQLKQTNELLFRSL